MNYVKANLIALLFVTAFVGDLALAEDLGAKLDTATFMAEVREDINARRSEYYQPFLEAARNTEVQAPQVAAARENSIYLPVVPWRGLAARDL